uniref:Uncharacterized protein n=1 Tax=Marmota marmota marmota TaxID=9994 RepID=A0A8C5ZPI2_MARMA
MSDRIFYIQSNFSSWESSAAAAVPPMSPSTPAYYHVLYQGCGETQVGWHGEAYCLVDGYQLALWRCSLGHSTKGQSREASREAKKKPKQRAKGALKKHCAPAEAEKALCFPSPQIHGFKHTGKRPFPQRLAG